MKVGREGVRDIHKSPDRLLVGKQLHVWRRGVGSDVWNLRRITRTFALQAVSTEHSAPKASNPVQAECRIIA